MNTETKPTLPKWLTDASEALETYRYPDVTEAQEKLKELVREMDLGYLRMEDTLRTIAICENVVIVTAEDAYDPCTVDFVIPIEVFTAKDSLKHAKLLKLNKFLKKANEREIYHQKQLKLARNERLLAEEELRELLKTLDTPT